QSFERIGRAPHQRHLDSDVALLERRLPPPGEPRVLAPPLVDRGVAEPRRLASGQHVAARRELIEERRLGLFGPAIALAADDLRPVLPAQHRPRPRRPMPHIATPSPTHALALRESRSFPVCFINGSKCQADSPIRFVRSRYPAKPHRTPASRKPAHVSATS